MHPYLLLTHNLCLAYEQQYCRTMFFEKCEFMFIDGVKYPISNAAQVELWTCKSKIVEIYNTLDAGMMDMQCSKDNWQQWRKDLVKLLKEWDSNYIKHIKGCHKEMKETVHDKAMLPLVDLMESNKNFYHLQQIEKKQKVPSFRHEALEAKFSEHFTIICNNFREYGDLKDPYDIPQMLRVLKI